MWIARTLFEELLPDFARFVVLELARFAAASAGARAFERQGVGFLVPRLLGLELHGFGECPQRFAWHVMLEVNFAERHQGFGAIGYDEFDALPGCERLFLVA